MDAHHKTRWVFTPMVLRIGGDLPAVEDYCTLIFAPAIYDGFALCRCTFNAQQFAAVVKDDRFIVCPSLHAHAKIHPLIARHHAAHGLREEMLLHEALEELGKLHHGFLPDF